MRTVTVAVAAAMLGAACSDTPSRIASPGPHADPFMTTIGADGNPVPSSSDRILVDTRTSLQQATSLTQAWAAFPGDDHSGARPAPGGTGWSFTTNFDGNGTHALRADWQGTVGSCPSPTVRVIDYFPTPTPKQVFVQWRQYLGRSPTDADGNGAANSFLVTNSACPAGGRQELRVLRDSVGGGALHEVDHVWVGSPQSAPSIVTDNGTIPGTQGWSFTPEANTGTPITITVYLQAESATGAADGVVRVWIDGKLFIERTGQSLGTYPFHRFELPSMFAGPPQSQSEYFWDVLAWQPSSSAPSPGVSRVVVTPQSGTIGVGGTLQLTATAYDQSGNPMSGQSFTWSSSKPAVASVNASGLVTGDSAGSATISATSGGQSGSSAITVTTSSSTPPNTAGGCASPQPGWLWCDDFEQDRTSSYFEYVNPNGSFTRQPGVGLNGSTGMRATWTAGQVSAGSLKLAFGARPSTYFRPVDAGTANYRELFWRVYVRSQPGWQANGNDKFSRAAVIATSNWAEAAIGHVWGGGAASSQDFYVLDPVRGTDSSGNLLTTTYNDFAHFTWLGSAQGKVPVFGSGAGQWYCVEAHMRLNDPGQSNGVLEEWINGTLDAQRTGLNFLGNFSAYGINVLFLENYINNGAPQAQVRDYDELVVSTQRIGCIGSSGGSPPPPTVRAASVTVSPSNVSLQTGNSAPLTVTVRDSSGNVISRPVTWQTSNPSVASLSGTSSTGATVTGNAQGSAMITATADSVSGTSSITVNNPPPPPPPPPPSGAPVPGPSSTILLDLRQSLQQVTTLDQAFNLFGQEDHTAPRTVQNGTGWSFTTNFDGQGTHALRADWAAYPQGDQGIRIVTYLPTPKPHEVYFQFKGYLGKNPADPDANGSDNTFPLYPQSNSVKRMLILRDGVGGSATDRIDYVWTRTDPSAARVQSDNLNWGFNSSPSIWAPNNYLGRAYTTTIYFKTSSANGVADAVYKIWIDGTLVLDAENVMLDGYAMDRWQFPDTAHNFPIPASEYYWDILVWRP